MLPMLVPAAELEELLVVVIIELSVDRHRPRMCILVCREVGAGPLNVSSTTRSGATCSKLSKISYKKGGPK